MVAEFPVARPRRLRGTAAMRRLVAEASVRPADLVQPLFVKEGIGEPQPVGSMPGVFQHTRESLRKAAEQAVEAGVGGLILFGIPAEKDARGSGADDPDGIVQLALSDLSADLGSETVLMADLCLDEYTDHGHCGILTADGRVDNDETLTRYASVALAQARAGAHVVAPSGMMDGQVAAIRTALDAAGFSDVAICAYAAKYASAFYGPFRDAAECAPQFGDRASYQQDHGSQAEALREVLLDVAEGADIVMIKPALAYLDVISLVSRSVRLPVAAYQVSGEYSMVEAASANGWLDRDKVIAESLTAIKRAGAGIILTYWATEVAAGLRQPCVFASIALRAGLRYARHRTVIRPWREPPSGTVWSAEVSQAGRPAQWSRRCCGPGAAGQTSGWCSPPAGTRRWAGRSVRALSPGSGCPRRTGSRRLPRAGPVRVTGLAVQHLVRTRSHQPGSCRRAPTSRSSGTGGMSVRRPASCW